MDFFSKIFGLGPYLSNPPFHTGRANMNERHNMTTTATTNQQMELGLAAKAVRRPAPRRQRRLPGARWWFAQMRLAVANAVEWGAPPPPRPEQIDLLCRSARS